MYNITKLQLAMIIIFNARKLGWNASIIHDKIYIRKKNNQLTSLDKNYKKLLKLLVKPIQIQIPIPIPI